MVSCQCSGGCPLAAQIKTLAPKHTGTQNIGTLAAKRKDPKPACGLLSVSSDAAVYKFFSRVVVDVTACEN
jgi:hypothetical protein